VVWAGMRGGVGGSGKKLGVEGGGGEVFGFRIKNLSKDRFNPFGHNYFIFLYLVLIKFFILEIFLWGIHVLFQARNDPIWFSPHLVTRHIDRVPGED
jgi:hypothetical protein